LNNIKFTLLLLAPLLCYTQTYFLLTSPQKEYIKYTIFLDDLINHPLTQPYSRQQLSNILLDDSSNYVKSIKHYYVKPGRVFSLGGLLSGHYSRSRLTPDNGIMVNIYGIYQSNRLSAVFKYQADSEYQNDDKYFGSSGKFGSNVIGRITDSYVQYSDNKFTLFLGRQQRNYGLINSPSLILSDEPYSYDHFLFEHKSKHFKYSYLATRLEDKVSYDIRDEIVKNEWHKRYLTFHRLDISISPELKVGLSESILYGGQNQSFLPMYLNPLNIWFISKMVERKGVEESNANVLMAFDILFKPNSEIAFYSQLLIDDMDFTKETRERYPDRIGFTARFYWLNPLPKSMLSLNYLRINNWTYNSYYTFGNYTFYGESLGYPQNGIERFELKFNLFYFDKMAFSSCVYSQKERQQDLESHFVDIKTTFPIGIVQTTAGYTMDVNYWLSVKGSITLRADYISQKNYENIHGDRNSLTNIQLSFDYIL
jgi:hypothetical protein